MKVHFNDCGGILAIKETDNGERLVEIDIAVIVVVFIFFIWLVAMIFVIVRTQLYICG